MLRYLSNLAPLALLLLSSCGTTESTFEGRWVGVLQTGSLPSGSSQVVLEIMAANIGEPVVATLVFGEGPPPGEPTDPELGWPAGVDPQLEAVPVADGYFYRSLDGTRTGDTLRIDIAITELWESWCALQTPHPVGGGSPEAQCLPNRPWDATPFMCSVEGDAENPELSVDCLKLSLCRRTRVCSCTNMGGCVPSPTGLTLEVEVTIEGEEAFGTLRWSSEDEPGTRTARILLAR
jgi:hypothetical protein